MGVLGGQILGGLAGATYSGSRGRIVGGLAGATHNGFLGGRFWAAWGDAFLAAWPAQPMGVLGGHIFGGLRKL